MRRFDLGRRTPVIVSVVLTTLCLSVLGLKELAHGQAVINNAFCVVDNTLNTCPSFDGCTTIVVVNDSAPAAIVAHLPRISQMSP